ncbi:hypothetical protein STANM309S_06298 [Streptomyces tanashiensis]
MRAPKVLAQYEHAVGRLLDAGFALPDVMPVIIALENIVLGSALDMAAPEAMWELADETATPRLARALGAAPEGRSEPGLRTGPHRATPDHVRTLLDTDQL